MADLYNVKIKMEPIEYDECSENQGSINAKVNTASTLEIPIKNIKSEFGDDSNKSKDDTDNKTAINIKKVFSEECSSGDDSQSKRSLSQSRTETRSRYREDGRERYPSSRSRSHSSRRPTSKELRFTPASSFRGELKPKQESRRGHSQSRTRTRSRSKGYRSISRSRSSRRTTSKDRRSRRGSSCSPPRRSNSRSKCRTQRICSTKNEPRNPDLKPNPFYKKKKIKLEQEKDNAPHFLNPERESSSRDDRQSRRSHSQSRTKTRSRYREDRQTDICSTEDEPRNPELWPNPAYYLKKKLKLEQERKRRREKDRIRKKHKYEYRESSREDHQSRSHSLSRTRSRYTEDSKERYRSRSRSLTEEEKDKGPYFLNPGREKDRQFKLLFKESRRSRRERYRSRSRSRSSTEEESKRSRRERYRSRGRSRSSTEEEKDKIPYFVNPRREKDRIEKKHNDRLNSTKSRRSNSGSRQPKRPVNMDYNCPGYHLQQGWPYPYPTQLPSYIFYPRQPQAQFPFLHQPPPPSHIPGPSGYVPPNQFNQMTQQNRRSNAGDRRTENPFYMDYNSPGYHPQQCQRPMVYTDPPPQSPHVFYPQQPQAQFPFLHQPPPPLPTSHLPGPSGYVPPNQSNQITQRNSRLLAITGIPSPPISKDK